MSSNECYRTGLGFMVHGPGCRCDRKARRVARNHNRDTGRDIVTSFPVSILCRLESHDTADNNCEVVMIQQRKDGSVEVLIRDSDGCVILLSETNDMLRKQK